MIREAVQENLPGVQQKQVRITRPDSTPRLWIYAVALAVFFACVVSAAVVYRIEPGTGDAAATQPPPGNAGSPAVLATGSEESIRAPEVAPAPLNRAVFPLAVRKIVIDAGHGGDQPGAVSQSKVFEKDVTLQIAFRLERLLKEHSFEVLMTRETDKTVNLDERVVLANTSEADLFISIHLNWVPVRKLHPLETYFLGPTDDPQTINLAARENRESGYSLSEYRHLLEKVYLDTRRDESHRFARAVHTRLYETVRRLNPAIQDRGVKTAPFVVLIHTEMPAILVEVSCLSNEDEVLLLSQPNYQEGIAAALLQGIQSYANDRNLSEEKIAEHGTIN